MATIPLPKAVKTWFGSFILLTYIFITSTLIINFLQLCSLIVWPFDKQLFRKINYYLGYHSWCQIASVAEWWSGCDCSLYAKPEDLEKIATEHIVVVMNHTYEIDWVMAWILSERFGLLGGCKIFGKDILRYVPLIGWAWHFTESIFLKRNWEKDESIMRKGLQGLLDYPDDYWFILLLFPEGTRFTAAKHEASLKVSREKGYPDLKYHLLPRTKGFAHTMKMLKGSKISALVDISVGFEGNVVKPSLMNVLRGEKILGHMRIERYDINSLPDSEKELSDWLRNLFVKKDQIMENYFKAEKFDLPEHQVKQRPYDLITTMFWASITCIPLFYYLLNVIISGSLLQQACIALVIVLLSIFSKWMVGFAEIEKGSSYGMNKSEKKTN